MNRTLLIVTLIAVCVMNAQVQEGGPGRPQAAPAAAAGFGALPPLGTTPKPAIANAKPVRSCESLATVALPNTTIESAAVDPAKYKGTGSTDDAANFVCSTGF